LATLVQSAAACVNAGSSAGISALLTRDAQVAPSLDDGEAAASQPALAIISVRNVRVPATSDGRLTNGPAWARATIVVVDLANPGVPRISEMTFVRMSESWLIHAVTGDSWLTDAIDE
jgi:hypothetical protein